MTKSSPRRSAAPQRQVPPANMSYGEVLKDAARRTLSKLGAPMSIRDVADEIGFSYEHTRKAFMGIPVVSSDMNEKFCTLFNLNQAAMEALSKREKMQRVADRLPSDLSLPDAVRVQETWKILSPEGKKRVAAFIDAVYKQEESLQGLKAKTEKTGK